MEGAPSSAFHLQQRSPHGLRPGAPPGATQDQGDKKKEARTPKGVGSGDLDRAWLGQGQARLAPDWPLSSILFVRDRPAILLPLSSHSSFALLRFWVLLRARHFAGCRAGPEMSEAQALP